MDVWVAAIGLIITVATFFIGARFNKNSEIDKFRKDRITAAYTALLEANAKSTSLRASQISWKTGTGQELTEEELKYAEDLQTQFVSAHSHVLIHGSQDVIAALSHFYDVQRPDSQNPDGTVPVEFSKAYVALLAAMRDDSAAANYRNFSDHVDNILVSGPMQRRKAFAEHFAAGKAAAGQRGRPGISVSYSLPEKPDE